MSASSEMQTLYRYLLTIIRIFNSDVPGLASRNRYCRKTLSYTRAKAAVPRLSSGRMMALLLTVAGYLAISVAFPCRVSAAGGLEKPGLPSIGSGLYELYIFTDYFCGPCQTLEEELDSTLQELIKRNAVKIHFVDLPIHRETVLFNRYFLYAACASGSSRNVLRARRELFSLAEHQDTVDEQKIVRRFEQRNIPFKVYDLKPVYPEFNHIIRQFNVHSTPTCVIKFNPADIRSYSGVSRIRQGMAVLLAATAASK
ncbi:DsbA family protein [Syntrophus buswellii]|uniref:DsbA family protein n=1 Tax=Syntrophus buswellii TaxID=43774 RepID=UPI0038D3B2ED